MKKQIALILLTNVAMQAAPTLAMDNKLQPQLPVNNVKNETPSNNCATCKEKLNITNSCASCKNVCTNCLKHKQELEKAASNRDDLQAKVCGVVIVGGIGSIILGAFYSLYKKHNPSPKSGN